LKFSENWAPYLGNLLEVSENSDEYEGNEPDHGMEVGGISVGVFWISIGCFLVGLWRWLLLVGLGVGGRVIGLASYLQRATDFLQENSGSPIVFHIRQCWQKMTAPTLAVSN
jgi:hypothetical protein